MEGKSFPGLCNVNKCGQINVIFTLKKRLIGKQNTYENEVNLITIKLYSRPLDLLFFCFKKRRDNTRLYGHFWS